jgi:hypothetical protein
MNVRLARPQNAAVAFPPSRPEPAIPAAVKTAAEGLKLLALAQDHGLVFNPVIKPNHDEAGKIISYTVTVETYVHYPVEGGHAGTRVQATFQPNGGLMGDITVESIIMGSPQSA